MNKTLCVSLLGLCSALVGCDGSIQAAGKTAQSSGQSASAWTPQWASVDSALLRPGQMTASGSNGCTAGFLFVDPVRQTYYLGTAGHCVGTESGEDGTGQRVSVVTVNEIIGALSESEQEVGTVVFDSDNTDLQQNFGVDPGVDFALVELDTGINEIAHPQVVSLDAPNGFVDCADIAPGDRFSFHGHGTVLGDNAATRTRPGLLAVCDGNDYGGYTGAIFGDSGGAVVYDDGGLALGLVSGAGTNTFPPTELTGPTLPFIFRELAKTGFGNVALATMDGGFVGPRGAQ